MTDFVDKTSGRADEDVLGVSVTMNGRGCVLQWNYPIGYSEVTVFEVPLYEAFEEEKALRGEYNEHILRLPENRLEAEGLVNFAIFPTNSAGKLVRQNVTTWRCSVKVCYAFESRVVTVKEGGFFHRPVTETHKYLKIRADIELPGKCVLYRPQGVDGVFCLPFTLAGGTVYSMEVREEPEIFTEEEFIACERVANL